MNAQEIIERIRTAEKKTPVKVYLTEKAPIDFPNATVFPCGETKLVFGDWKDIQPVLDANKNNIAQLVIENDSRNSAIPRPGRPGHRGQELPHRGRHRPGRGRGARQRRARHHRG